MKFAILFAKLLDFDHAPFQDRACSWTSSQSASDERPLWRDETLLFRFQNALRTNPSMVNCFASACTVRPCDSCGFRRHRTDRRDPHSLQRFAAGDRHQILHGRGAGERDPIRSFRAAEHLASARPASSTERRCDTLPPHRCERRAFRARPESDPAPRPPAAAARAFPAGLGGERLHQALGDVFFGHQVHFQVQILDGSSVAGPMAQMRAFKRPEIVPRPIQAIHEKTHAVHAGEDQPIVAGQMLDGPVERARISGRLRSRSPATRSASAPSERSRSDNSAGLVLRARHHDLPSEQRQLLIPSSAWSASPPLRR